MNIHRHLIASFVFLFALTAMANGQIHYKGEKFYPVNGSPMHLICKDLQDSIMVAYNLEYYIGDDRDSNDCSDLFDFYGDILWSFIGNTLCITGLNSNDFSILVHTLSKDVREGHIVASWYSGDLIIGKGNCLISPIDSGSGHERNYQREIILHLRNGVIQSKKSFRNKEYKGFDPYWITKDINQYFPFQKYAELSGSRIAFQFSPRKVNNRGKVSAYDVEIVGPSKQTLPPSTQTSLIKDFEEALLQSNHIPLFRIRGNWVCGPMRIGENAGPLTFPLTIIPLR